MKPEDKKASTSKRPYRVPEVLARKMTGHFMVCSSNYRKCPPGTSIFKKNVCYT